MKLNTLKPAEGSITRKKRIGRGQGSGKGGTSTKGHKGDQSRSGNKYKAGFEGGQMPIQRRLPKFGFKNPFRVEYQILNLERLQEISEKYGTTNLSYEFLAENGYIARSGQMLKILGEGEIKSALNLTCHKLSASAKQAIEALNGSVTILPSKAKRRNPKESAE